MSLHFHRELEQLRKQYLNLFAQVEEALVHSYRALNEADFDLARAVIDNDQPIDLAEVNIEEECLKILALYQPVADDLRIVTAILKINRDLERIGDQAVSVAKIALKLKPCGIPELTDRFNPLMQKVLSMTRTAFDAMMNADVDRARRVWQEDDEADAMTGKVIDEIKAALALHPERAESLLPLYSLAFVLERIGDHAANIAKDVIYSVEGRIVRHRGREFKHAPAAPETGGASPA